MLKATAEVILVYMSIRKNNFFLPAVYNNVALKIALTTCRNKYCIVLFYKIMVKCHFLLSGLHSI